VTDDPRPPASGEPPTPQQPYPQQPYPQQPYGQPYGGYPAAYGLPVLRSAPTSGKATTVLVLGVASLLLMFMCGIGLITAIVALVLAPGAQREIQQSEGRLTGLGMVSGGVVCSWITIGLIVLIAAVIVLVVAVGASFGDFENYRTV
jgi:hypothetical protein